MIDPLVLAARMHGFTPGINEASGWVTRHCHFDGPPHGCATLSFSPHTRGGGVNSENFNRIALCGGAGLTGEGLEALCDLLRADGAERFFIGLMPGPEMDTARDLIQQADFVRNPWVRYPTLALTDAAKPRHPTDLVVREVKPEEARSAADALGDAMWPSFARSAGAPGFHHFLAFDDEHPVAHAALATDGELAYLGWMSTAKMARCRGAQRALIAARIARARELGSTLIVSETLSIIESSLANLERAGFRTVYEIEVYGPPSP